jgi:hypothetical protein
MGGMRSAPLLLLLSLTAPATAAPVRATYEVFVAGMVVLQVEATFDLRADGYAVETRLATRGMAAAFVTGSQTSRADGRWEGLAARPRQFTSDGVWRGRERRVALEWQANAPRLLALIPPNEEERDAVPESLQGGTVDSLSALAVLARQVQANGRCEASAAVFDGRRLSDYAARTERRDAIAPWRNGWAGEALRCTFEAKQVAGFRRDQRPEQAPPSTGTAWMAAPYPGAPPIPVRVEIPNRWFGPATAVLLRAEPAAP